MHNRRERYEELSLGEGLPDWASYFLVLSVTLEGVFGEDLLAIEVNLEDASAGGNQCDFELLPEFLE